MREKMIILVQKWMILMPLPVGHQLRCTEARQQSSRLQLHTQTTATEPFAGAGDEDANERGGH